jgi:hypothetical protein
MLTLILLPIQNTLTDSTTEDQSKASEQRLRGSEKLAMMMRSQGSGSLHASTPRPSTTELNPVSAAQSPLLARLAKRQRSSGPTSRAPADPVQVDVAPSSVAIIGGQTAVEPYTDAALGEVEAVELAQRLEQMGQTPHLLNALQLLLRRDATSGPDAELPRYEEQNQ